MSQTKDRVLNDFFSYSEAPASASKSLPLPTAALTAAPTSAAKAPAPLSNAATPQTSEKKKRSLEETPQTAVKKAKKAENLITTYPSEVWITFHQLEPQYGGVGNFYHCSPRKPKYFNRKIMGMFLTRDAANERAKKGCIEKNFGFGPFADEDPPIDDFVGQGRYENGANSGLNTTFSQRILVENQKVHVGESNLLPPSADGKKIKSITLWIAFYQMEAQRYGAVGSDLRRLKNYDRTVLGVFSTRQAANLCAFQACERRHFPVYASQRNTLDFVGEGVMINGEDSGSTNVFSQRIVVEEYQMKL